MIISSPAASYPGISHKGKLQNTWLKEDEKVRVRVLSINHSMWLSRIHGIHTFSVSSSSTPSPSTPYSTASASPSSTSPSSSPAFCYSPSYNQKAVNKCGKFQTQLLYPFLIGTYVSKEADISQLSSLPLSCSKKVNNPSGSARWVSYKITF